jgi:hypothetical protein
MFVDPRARFIDSSLKGLVTCICLIASLVFVLLLKGFVSNDRKYRVCLWVTSSLFVLYNRLKRLGVILWWANLDYVSQMRPDDSMNRILIWPFLLDFPSILRNLFTMIQYEGFNAMIINEHSIFILILSRWTCATDFSLVICTKELKLQDLNLGKVTEVRNN